jgi:hypothetical protein
LRKRANARQLGKASEEYSRILSEPDRRWRACSRFIDALLGAEPMRGIARTPHVCRVDFRWMVAGAAVALGGCDRGCDGERGFGAIPSVTSGSMPLRVVDCPDGLARCENGVVSVSRLAMLPMPCHGPPSACACPWEMAAECPAGCAADGIELTVERSRAESQLCAPARGGGAYAAPAPAPSPTPVAQTLCEEGERYRCDDGGVVECASSHVVGLCARGCFADGTSIDDDTVNREAAFAILCSR